MGNVDTSPDALASVVRCPAGLAISASGRVQHAMSLTGALSSPHVGCFRSALLNIVTQKGLSFDAERALTTRLDNARSISERVAVLEEAVSL